MDATRANLSVSSRLSQLILPLLVVGLSLAPGLAALVPVVPRDAHRSALAGKRKRKASRSGLSMLVLFTNKLWISVE